MDKNSFTRFLTVYRHHSEKTVEEVEFKLVAEGIQEGELRITDIQVQEGSEITGTIPATQDILKLVRFSIDESHNEVTSRVNIYNGQEPQNFENKTHRFFNVVGRGFETIAIPNVYHESILQDIITTGLDLTLVAKDDYDFLRISTFYGGTVDGDNRTYKNDSLADNPLNQRYTREFCFSGGNAGDKIELLSSQQRAMVNGQVVPKGVQRFNVGQDIEWSELEPAIYTNRQRFMALPTGATRLVVQFMKLEYGDDGTEYMVDNGIGFQGLAEFTQWSWGVSKY